MHVRYLSLAILLSASSLYCMDNRVIGISNLARLINFGAGYLALQYPTSSNKAKILTHISGMCERFIITPSSDRTNSIVTGVSVGAALLGSFETLHYLKKKSSEEVKDNQIYKKIKYVNKHMEEVFCEDMEESPRDTYRELRSTLEMDKIAILAATPEPYVYVYIDRIDKSINKMTDLYIQRIASFNKQAYPHIPIDFNKIRDHIELEYKQSL